MCPCTRTHISLMGQRGKNKELLNTPPKNDFNKTVPLERIEKTRLVIFKQINNRIYDIDIQITKGQQDR